MSDGLGHGARESLVIVAAFAANGSADQADGLVGRRQEWHVNETALDLSPLVTNIAAGTGGILSEALVQHADRHQPTAAAIAAFGQVLQKMDVSAIGDGVLQKLAQFVDDQEDAALGASALGQAIDQYAVVLRRSSDVGLGPFQCVACGLRDFFA